MASFPFVATSIYFNIVAILTYYWHLRKTRGEAFSELSDNLMYNFGCLFFLKISSIISLLPKNADESFLFDVYESPVNGAKKNNQQFLASLLNIMILACYPVCIIRIIMDFRSIGGSLPNVVWAVLLFPLLFCVLWHALGKEESVTVRITWNKFHSITIGFLRDFWAGFRDFPRLFFQVVNIFKGRHRLLQKLAFIVTVVVLLSYIFFHFLAGHVVETLVGVGIFFSFFWFVR